MNLIILTGRLTRDPEVRYGKESGNAVAHFRIAVNRDFRRDGDPEADFFDCSCFGKTAEFVQKYFHKGMKADVYGSMRNNDYKDKDGNLVRSFEVSAIHVEFGESKKSSQAAAPAGNGSAPVSNTRGSSLPDDDDSDDSLFDWDSDSDSGVGDAVEDDSLPFN